MARSVTFNGITRFTPGGITRINAAALAQVTLGENSILAIIGEAEGGASGAEGGLVTFFEPSRSADVYKSGPVVDALNLAFQASNDPDVPGGASRVYVYKTNDSTKASVSLPNGDATVIAPIDGDILLAGLPTATAGSGTTLADTAGDLGTLSLGENNSPNLVGKWLVVRPFATDMEFRQIETYVESTNTLGWTTALTGDVLASDTYLILEDEVEVLAAPVSSTATTLVLDDGIISQDDEHVGRWVYIQDADGFEGPGATYLRQITDSDAGTDTLTFSPSIPVSALTAGAYYQILANVIDLESKDWGQHTNGITVDVADTNDGRKVVTVEFEGEEEVSPSLGNRSILEVLYKGGATSSVSDDVDTGSTVTQINLKNVTLVADAEIGYQFEVNGEFTEIVDNDTSSVTVSPALSEAPAENADFTIHRVRPFARVAGAAGVATALTTDFVGASGSELSITFANNQTLRELVNEINQNPAYEARWGLGINPDTTLVADLDFGPEATFTMYASPHLGVTSYATRDIADMVDYFNDFSSYVQAARATDTGSTVAGLTVPAEIAEPVAFAGGSRGTSTDQSFQDGFNELLKLRVNSVIPLIDQDLSEEGNNGTARIAAVAAQAGAHVAAARGVYQDIAGERGAFVGFRGTKSEIIAQANTLNDQDVALVCQNPTTLNRQGSLVEFGPRMLAVMAASMRAGVTEVAEPLTHKLIRTSGLTQDSSWDPTNLTDANEMIIAGVLFAETIDGTGTRWVRDLTTWVADDNLAYSEGSVRDAVRYVAYGLRTTLVERFTGKKATPATIGNVKDAAATYLELTRQDNIIVDSTDPTTGEFVKAYHNLKVTSSGDTVTINVGIFPVPGINFQLTDIFLQLPTQSA